MSKAQHFMRRSQHIEDNNVKHIDHLFFNVKTSVIPFTLLAGFRHS